MPYPESCPECGSTFRNTGTHFTARRNEVGRHVLLELGCQNTARRFWWDFTTGSPTEDGRPSPARRTSLAETVGADSASNGSLRAESNGTSFHPATNGHVALSTLDRPQEIEVELSTVNPVKDLESRSIEDQLVSAPEPAPRLESMVVESAVVEPAVVDSPSMVADVVADQQPAPDANDESEPQPEAAILELPAAAPGVSASLKDAFVRQLQLDRLTLRQMRSWLMSEEARRAIEVAAGATEATYERLALILFESDLPQLLGKPSAPPQSTGMTAEERLELQREKARIRARLRRAAAKTARA